MIKILLTIIVILAIPLALASSSSSYDMKLFLISNGSIRTDEIGCTG